MRPPQWKTASAIRSPDARENNITEDIVFLIFMNVLALKKKNIKLHFWHNRKNMINKKINFKFELGQDIKTPFHKRASQPKCIHKYTGINNEISIFY